MKFAVALLALVSFAAAAPQPKKIFHEHFDDFLELIQSEVGDELNDLLAQYIVNAEFRNSLEYMRTPKFRNLVYEMEALSEFQALQQYLDTHNVDLTYFLDTLNALIDNTSGRRVLQARESRFAASGTDFNSFVKDGAKIFPQPKLAALFDQKIDEDADFKAAIEGIQSEEFDQIYGALWANPTFLAEVQTLNDNGIDVLLLLDELLAMFGQKY